MAISCIGSLKGRGAIMTPRSLVGMTMGARRRRLRRESAILRANLPYLDDINVKLMVDPTVAVRRLRPLVDLQESYQLGQRLRPCPGCQKCGSSVRRFAPTAGWKSPRKWILWDGAKLWMIARTWRRLCTVPTLADYTSGVDDGTWQELFCDGSGVLPARAKKVRR